jgi:hypothetical protein
MDAKLLWTLPLMVLLLRPGLAMPQDAAPSRHDLDPHALVEFNFTNSDIGEVVHHFVQFTGWPVFYDAALVRGKVTIVTPGKIPLAQAARLLRGVLRTHGQSIQVLTPRHPQPVPLAAVLTELSQPPERRDVLVWRSSNARDPQARPGVCDQRGSTYPLSLPWIDVIVDQRR